MQRQGAKSVDIIVPTMWRTPEFSEIYLPIYEECPEVNAVIIIDNDPRARPAKERFERSTKVRIISQEENIYVNPAWNEGAAVATSEWLCILNDDIAVESEIFSMISELDWRGRSIDIIGLNLQDDVGETRLEKISPRKDQPLGPQFPSYGACMFLPRLKYRYIPDDFKIWFGDDYLVRHADNVFLLTSPGIRGIMSNTIGQFGEGSSIQERIREDIANAGKALLPTLCDVPGEGSAAANAALDSPSSTVAVDLGCGVTPLNPFGADKLIGIDAQCDGGDILQCWIGFEPMPLADSSVDFVSAYDLVEHIPRFAFIGKPVYPFIDAMSDIWRVLKPGGIFFARTPAYPSAAAFQDPTHVNIITDQTISYFARRPCLDGSEVDSWGLPLGGRYGFRGEFVLVKQWWDTTHLCWHLEAVK